jgi:BirA family biotin operon repressor/biotin-[acetyl-CoA-carboxylase] ligase
VNPLVEPIEYLPGWRHLALEDTGSTNTEAMRLAREGDPGRLWVTARRQIEGRGRRGRPWVSEAGNLYASLLLLDPGAPSAIAALPLVAALGVYRALKPLFVRTPQALAIKWPNDILVDGAKINGILLESGQIAGGRLAVVIGCGINCRHHPSDTLYRATDLAACGLDVGPEEMFRRLAPAMAETLAQWDRGAGFGAIRDDWLRAARGIGEAVTVSLPQGRITGTFENIDGDGYLCLLLPDGRRERIPAGDLFF